MHHHLLYYLVEIDKEIEILLMIIEKHIIG